MIVDKIGKVIGIDGASRT